MQGTSLPPGAVWSVFSCLCVIVMILGADDDMVRPGPGRGMLQKVPQSVSRPLCRSSRRYPVAPFPLVWPEVP